MYRAVVVISANLVMLCSNLAYAQAPSLASPQTDAIVPPKSSSLPSVSLQSNALYMSSFETSSKLYVVNSVNGAATLVGQMGIQCTDIAFSRSALFGISFIKFFSINPATGAITGISNHGFTDLNALVAAGPTNPVTFYAAGFNDNLGKGANFVRINSATGAATVVGQFGPGLTSAGDLTFLGGVLFATVNKTGSATTWLAKIDTSTGKATLIGDTRFQSVSGLTVRNGVLYGATGDGKLLQIDPTLGVAVLLGNNGLNQGGLSTSPQIFGR